MHAHPATSAPAVWPGDVWYIPANMPHAVLGLAPMGCNFVSGFKDGGFDELTSMSASNWLPTVPVDTLALVSHCYFYCYCYCYVTVTFT